jgi:hypothetical protein
MVCIVCLTNKAPSSVEISQDNTATFQAALCTDHAHELQDVIRHWIRSNRENAIVKQHEEAKHGSKAKNWNE